MKAIVKITGAMAEYLKFFENSQGDNWQVETSKPPKADGLVRAWGRCDEAFNPDSNEAGVGLVIRNDHYELIGGIGKKVRLTQVCYLKLWLLEKELDWLKDLKFIKKKKGCNADWF